MKRDDLTEKEAAAVLAKNGRLPRRKFGQCFDQALNDFLSILNENPEAKVRLVHGIGISNMPERPPDPIAHAWVECEAGDKVLCLDPVWEVAVLKEKYYETLKVSHTINYGFVELLTLAHIAKKEGLEMTGGPWDAKISAVIKAHEGK